MLNKQIDRLRAESDLRQLMVGAGSQGHGVKDLQDSLRSEMGTPLRIERGFDAAKFKELREKLKVK